jgi:hypothetical protein
LSGMRSTAFDTVEWFGTISFSMAIILAPCTLYNSCFTSGWFDTNSAVFQILYVKNFCVIALRFQVNKKEKQWFFADIDHVSYFVPFLFSSSMMSDGGIE